MRRGTGLAYDKKKKCQYGTGTKAVGTNMVRPKKIRMYVVPEGQSNQDFVLGSWEAMSRKR